MKQGDTPVRRERLSEQEKGIIFGIVLGTVISLFVEAFKGSIMPPAGGVTRVNKSR